MITRCKTCLYPTTKPDLHFVDGECSACRNYRARKLIDWDARAEDFNKLVDSIPRNDSGFDCIVPSSGGKDSTAQVLKMIELGLRPLVITARTCHLTELGRKNIDNLSRYAETIEFCPDKDVRAALNRLGLEMVGDISLPEHFAIFSTPFRAAAAFGIPLIVYGESPTMEYGGPPGSEESKTMTKRYIMEHQGFLGTRPSDFIGADEGRIKAPHMESYMLPDADKMANIAAVFMGQYFEWDSHENARVSEQAGFEFERPCCANHWEFENLDNAQTGIHDFFGLLKYGYGRGAAQLSVDIRSGRITREEALQKALVIEGMFPSVYAHVQHTDVLECIGISEARFWVTAGRFIDKSLFRSSLDERYSIRVIDL
jgi:N-acetyl sugar amidotransferase